MSIYNVIIVDDSPFMRKVFTDVIDADSAFNVLATAANGLEAVRLALELKPDIITMDLEMPEMNGLEALQQIMTISPIPIIMLSAVTDNGTRDTIKALQYGALDFIRKPDGSVNLDIKQVGVQLLEKLHIALETMNGGSYRMLPSVLEREYPIVEGPARTAQLDRKDSKPRNPRASKDIETAEQKESSARIRTRAPARLTQDHPGAQKTENRIRQPEARSPSEKAPHQDRATTKSSTNNDQTRIHTPKVQIEADKPLQKKKSQVSTAFSHLVAIGTSTGGPRALHEVLTHIPADYPAPILVVQHMPPKFTHSLAQRLDSFCHIHVREAIDGEWVESATAYIAPGGKHMSLTADREGKFRIKLSQEGPVGGHMPSVDVLFESLIGQQRLKRHIVLMTGMGSDGAKGMKALQLDGAITTIAEAEETCVVYGMPRSAVALGAASNVLPLQQIAGKLIQEVITRK